MCFSFAYNFSYPNSLMKFVKLSIFHGERKQNENKKQVYDIAKQEKEAWKWLYLKSSLPYTKKSIECLLSVIGQCYVKTMFDIWSVYLSPSRTLLKPFDSASVSCKLICGMEWSIRVTMLFRYPYSLLLKWRKSRRKQVFEPCYTSWQ